MCKKAPEIDHEIYGSAVDLLLHIHKNPAPKSLLKYDMNIYLKESKLLTEWYLPAAVSTPLSKSLIDDLNYL